MYHIDSYRIIPQLVVAICTGSEACATNTSARPDGATDARFVKSVQPRSQVKEVKIEGKGW